MTFQPGWSPFWEGFVRFWLFRRKRSKKKKAKLVHWSWPWQQKAKSEIDLVWQFDVKVQSVFFNALSSICVKFSKKMRHLQLKLRTCLVACVFLMTIVVVASACQIIIWREHDVLCYRSGYRARGRDGKWIWVKEKPLICGPIRKNYATKEFSVADIIAIVLGVIACLICHLHYAIAVCF